MINISPDAPENAILDFVKRWMKLLADNRLEEACTMLDEPSQQGIVWTPNMIRELVNEIFNSDTVFYNYHPEEPVFSDPYELEEQKDRGALELDDGGYAFDYNVPLNGEWSDLTAQFEFKKRPDGYAVVLHDLHVM